MLKMRKAKEDGKKKMEEKKASKKVSQADFEKKVLAHLGLKREPVATQVIPRDRHGELLNTLALLGSTIERVAVELRHLQRSEVGEVLEGFAKGQKGSSAMPHKRNPITGENLTGCARLFCVLKSDPPVTYGWRKKAPTTPSRRLIPMRRRMIMFES